MIGRGNAYNRSGPHGPLLWYVLADVKKTFISLVVRSWSKAGVSDRTLTDGFSEWLCKHAYECAAGLEGTSSLKTQLIDTLVSSWPASSDQSEQQRLAEHRVVQLSRYLKTAADRLVETAAATQLSGSSSIEPFLGAVGEFIWPYYFVRPGAPFRDSLITWLPGTRYIRRPIVLQQDHDAPKRVFPGDSGLLYPSIAELLHHSSKKEDIALVQTLETSFDLGYWPSDFSVASYGAIPPNVGHVQDYSPLPGDTFAYYDSCILETAPEASRFSDAFYLNREALYVEDIDRKSGAVIGRLILCSPLPHLLFHLKLMSKTNPPPLYASENNDSNVESLANFAREAWNISGGIETREELSRTLILQDEEFVEQRKKVIEESFSFISHSVTGALVKSFAPPVDVTHKVHAAHQLVAIDTSSAIALIGLRTEPVDWKSRDNKNPGRLIEEALTLPSFSVKILDQVLVDVVVDSRFISLVHELARNARSHRCKDTSSVEVDIRRLKIKSSTLDAVSVHLETLSTIEDCRQLIIKLRTGSRRSGVAFLHRLSSQLSSTSSFPIRWVFAASDGPLEIIPECPCVHVCPQVREMLHSDTDKVVTLGISTEPLVAIKRW